MADIVLADIQKRISDAQLAQLTDDAAGAVIVEAIVNEAIAAGYAEAWPYVGVKYSVPISPTPDALKPHIISCAIKYLYARKVEEMPQTRKDDYDRAVRFFRDVSQGVASLGVDPAPAAPLSGASESNSETSTRIFTRDKLKGF